MRWLPVVAAIGVIIASVAVSEPVSGTPAAETPTEASAAPSVQVNHGRVPFWRRCVTGRKCVRAVLPHFFANWRYVMTIVGCETGGTFYHRAVGSAGERGIFQIHPIHFGWVDEGRLWDVRYSSRIAKRLSRNGTDWSPWSCA